jgi:hypothetical protein
MKHSNRLTLTLHAASFFEIRLLYHVAWMADSWDNPHFRWTKCPKSVPAHCSGGIFPIDSGRRKPENGFTKASVRPIRETPRMHHGVIS